MSKVKVNGTADLRVWYSVELDMSEEEFYKLSEREQDKLIEEAIDWHETCRSAQVSSIEVDDVEEQEEQS